MLKRYLSILFSSGILIATILTPVAHAAGGTTPTAKPASSRALPAENTPCVKLGEIRKAPNIILICGNRNRKLVWQRVTSQAQKIPDDKLYKPPPPLKPQTPSLTLESNVKSSRVGVPISLQPKGGAGNGAISFIANGSGCYTLENKLFATNAGICGVFAKKDGDAIYNPSYSEYYQYNFEGLAPGTLLVSNTNLLNTVGTQIALSTSGGNGNPIIKYSITNKDCILNGSIITAVKKTSCFVTATQDQFGQYKTTTSAAVGFKFASPQSTLELTPAGSTIEFGTVITLNTIGGSGSGDVTFDVTGQGCLLAGNNLTAIQKASCVVIAKKAEDDVHNETFTKSVVFTFVPPPLAFQSPLVLSVSSKTLIVGQAVTLVSSGGSGTGAITYSVTGKGCTVAESSVTSATPVSCVVTAKKARDSNYLEAISNYVVVTFVPQPLAAQSPLVLSVSSQTLSVGQAVTLISSGGSGTGAITYSVTGNGCTVAGSSVTSATPVSCVVTAKKARDSNYLEAISNYVVVTFLAVSKTTFAISSQKTDATINQRIELTTTGAVAGAVSYAVISGRCSITDSYLTSNVATVCNVIAVLKPTDSKLTLVTSTPVIFIFNNTVSPLLINNSVLTGIVGKLINLGTSGGNGNPISFTVVSAKSNNCIITGSTLNALSATSCRVTAIQDPLTGTTKVTSPEVTFAFTFDPGKINQAPLTLVASNTNSVAFTSIPLSVIGGSGTGSVGYTVTGPGCSIQSDAVVANRATTCSVIATKEGNDQYNKAFAGSVLFRFAITSQPVLSITNPDTAFSTSGSITVSIQTAGGSGTGLVTIKEIDNNSKCAINSLQLTVNALEATTCRIVAFKAGDQAYSSIESQPVVFTFRKP